jgi:predicted metal-dependent peptidase
MKFNSIICKDTPAKDVDRCAKLLTKLFMDLGSNPENKDAGASKLGGDPLVFTILVGAKHILTEGVPTAATDGSRFYWNPKFLLSFENNIIGLRILAHHESFHSIYMHPDRRGARNPRLWNIAVDYIVNFSAMDDLNKRNYSGKELMIKHLGNYITLTHLLETCKNPFNADKSRKELVRSQNKFKSKSRKKIDYEKELTDEERAAVDKIREEKTAFYADPDLPADLRNPEKIYAVIYNALPKCPECGKLGVFVPKKNGKQSKNNPQQNNPQQNQSGQQPQGQQPGQQGQGQQPGGNQPGGQQGQGQQPGGNQPGNQPGQCCGNNPNGQPGCGHNPNGQSGQGNQPGNQPGQCCGNDPNGQSGSGCSGGCGTCGGEDAFDILGIGDTLDDHLDPEESMDKIAQRLYDAIMSAKKMAGNVPAALEEELNALTKPKITWKDLIRGKLRRLRAGSKRNDWNNFKRKSLFAGLVVPKKKDYFASFACLIDCSGSMSSDDIAFGLSQLQSLDDRGEGTLVPADAEIYWDKAIKVKSCKEEELVKFTPTGRGGTMFGSFFQDYEKETGEDPDFYVVITDGFLLDSDYASMLDPGKDVIWIITSDNPSFKPGFGRVCHLRG